MFYYKYSFYFFYVLHFFLLRIDIYSESIDPTMKLDKNNSFASVAISFSKQLY